MNGKKKFLVTLLFFINIIMLIVAVFPHHHHSDGMICMKQDLPIEQQCPMNHHHHPENDSCCHSECMTHFQSPTPSLQSHSGPDYILIATLFTDDIIEHLLRPLEKRARNNYDFRESLHGTNIPRTFSLRAPPCSVFA